MNRFRCLVSLVLTLSLTAIGTPDTAQWSKVKALMTSDTGYSLRMDYAGPEGKYYFNYVVHGDGDRILTEVLDGSTRGAGTRIYYNPAQDSENVTMQTSMFRLRRSLQARDIKDSPLYKPLFVHLLEEFSEPEPREVKSQKPGTTVFLFGDESAQHEYLTVDGDGNPLTIRRMEAGKEVNSLNFHDLEWGQKPIDWEE